MSRFAAFSRDVTFIRRPPSITLGINSANPLIVKIGEFFFYNISAVGIGNITDYSISPTNTLPSGVDYQDYAGAIYGTPVQVSQTDTSTIIYVTVTGTLGSVSANLEIIVQVGPPVISLGGTTGLNMTKGVVYGGYQITATNTPTSYSATGLPPGISINTSTGLISGTPTQGGSFTVLLSASNIRGPGTEVSLNVEVALLVPVITSNLNASGLVGTAFSYQITATNTPTSYSATGLPPGISINTSTGLISGTPTQGGAATITIGATNVDGTGTATLSLGVVVLVNESASWQIFDTRISGTIGAPPETAISLQRGTIVDLNCNYLDFPVSNSGGMNFIRINLKDNSYSYDLSRLQIDRSSGTDYGTQTYTELKGGVYPQSVFGMFKKDYAGTPTATLMTGSYDLGQDSSEIFAYDSTDSGSVRSIGPLNVGLEYKYLNNTNTLIAADVEGTFFTGDVYYNKFTNYYTGPGVKYGSTKDCKTLASTGTHYLVAGGSGGFGSLAIIPIANLAAYNTAWDLVAFEKGVITKLSVVQVYLNYTTASWNSSYFVVNPASLTTIVFAGTENGVIGRSLDNGYTWTYPSVQPFGGSDAVISFACSDISIYAATDTGKIAKSSDGGLNWVRLTIGATPTSLKFTKASRTYDNYKDFLYSSSSASVLKTKKYIYIGGGAGFLARTPADLISVSDITAPVVNSSLSQTTNINAAFTYRITATNSPVSYSATNLPSGFSINENTGLIYGRPGSTGTFNITIRAINPAGTGSATLVLTVAAAIAGLPVISSASTIATTVGTSVSYQLTASGSPTTYTVSDFLPSGLTFNTSTGVLSGSLGTSGSMTILLGATNGVGTGYTWLTITAPDYYTVATNTAGPYRSSALKVTAYLGVPFTHQITTTNGGNSYQLYSTSVLPTGLSLSSSGLISGTPTVGTGIDSGTNTRTISILTYNSSMQSMYNELIITVIMV
jgi:hypothetical protein